MVYETKSPGETRKLAEKIALEVIKIKNQKAVVIALEGELGAGKTTFVQGFVKWLGIEAKVKSPTFVLMKKYGIPNTGKNLFHLDCYRLRDYKDLKPLGIKEIFKNPENIILIEWAERVAEIILEESIKIHFDHIDNTTRKITVDDEGGLLRNLRSTTVREKGALPVRQRCRVRKSPPLSKQ